MSLGLLLLLPGCLQVSQNATRVFGFLTAYVAATCGVMHGAKAAAKWLAWRVPR